MKKFASTFNYCYKPQYQTTQFGSVIILWQADWFSFNLRILSALYQQKFNQRKILFDNLISAAIFFYRGIANLNDVKITYKIKKLN